MAIQNTIIPSKGATADEVTLTLSGGSTMSVKAQGVDTAQLKDLGVTLGKLALTTLPFTVQRNAVWSLTSTNQTVSHAVTAGQFAANDALEVIALGTVGSPDHGESGTLEVSLYDGTDHFFTVYAITAPNYTAYITSCRALLANGNQKTLMTYGVAATATLQSRLTSATTAINMPNVTAVNVKFTSAGGDAQTIDYYYLRQIRGV
jgi:hypothetical protein